MTESTQIDRVKFASSLARPTVMRNLGSKLFMFLVVAMIVGGLGYAFLPEPVEVDLVDDRAWHGACDRRSRRQDADSRQVRGVRAAHRPDAADHDAGGRSGRCRQDAADHDRAARSRSARCAFGRPGRGAGEGVRGIAQQDGAGAGDRFAQVRRMPKRKSIAPARLRAATRFPRPNWKTPKCCSGNKNEELRSTRIAEEDRPV